MIDMLACHCTRANAKSVLMGPVCTAAYHAWRSFGTLKYSFATQTDALDGRRSHCRGLH
jgi:hypothetical protein